jgi:hypothetical protein
MPMMKFESVFAEDGMVKVEHPNDYINDDIYIPWLILIVGPLTEVKNTYFCNFK